MSASGARRWAPGRRGALELAVLAALAYLPALLTAPGVVAADTKQYLYLDPGRLLARAGQLWDPTQFGGHVTHQTVGYLWPMGPWFWVWDQIGIPDWVAQRLWLGTVLLAAGAGMRFLAHRLGLLGAGALVAALVYQLTPFVLTYANRTSVLLTPWAGLGWLVGAAVLAARRGGWRWPAVIALVVGTVGGINATAVVLVGLAPATWLLHAGFRREVPWRRVGAVAGRVALLAVPVNAWWAVPLLVQARYGADVLAYSETIDAVSTTSSAPEVLRGLGYWLFYGADVLGPWNSAAPAYLQQAALLGLGLGLVTLAVAALVWVRWSASGWLATLLVVGTVVAVGAHPPGDPSPWGSVLTGDAGRSTLVLALRSSTRAVPLVVGAVALALGGLVAAAGARAPGAGRALAAGLAVLAVLQLPAAWTGGYVDDQLRRPEDLPAWWPETARRLDAAGTTTRVLEVPGQEFAAYRWGTTTDPLLPGLTDRPVITRDLLPLGSAPLMDLVWALDDRIQAGTFEPASLDPVGRLLGVGDVVVRGDAAWEKYRTTPPEVLAAGLAGRPGTELGPPATDPAADRFPDERVLSEPAMTRPAAPVRIVPVADPLPVARVRTGVVGIDGDGAGIVGAATAGLLPADRAVVPAAAVADDASLRALVAGAPLVVTDGNRLRARQWRGSQDTIGMTEDGAGPPVLVPDPADARLPVFPDAPAGSSTLAVQTGGGRATASGYGSPVAYWPEARPVHAFDGDPTTAWSVADGADGRGAVLRLDLDQPRPVGRLVLRQLGPDRSNRAITRLRVRRDGETTDVDLDASSRTGAGQAVELPERVTSRLELEVLATDPGPEAPVAGLGPVGFVDVDAGVHLAEEVRVPTRLASLATPGQPLAYVFERERVDPRLRWRDDPEPAMTRRLTVPQDRAVTVTGTARLSGRAPESVTDALVGDGSVVADAHLGGVPAAGGRAALDGDPATAWQTPFGAPVGPAVTVAGSAPLTVDRLRVAVTDDARHSVPTEVVVSAGGESRRVALPPEVREPEGAEVRLDPPLRGPSVTVAVSAAEERSSLDRRTGASVVLPSAVRTIELPGLAPRPARTTLDAGCRDDLLTVDDEPVPVRVQGPLDGATIEACAPVALGAGDHVVRTAPGRQTGIDLDRLVLDDPGTGIAAAPPAPAVTLERSSPTSVRATIEPGPGGPAWFVWGEGWNSGWEATAAGRDLGAPSPLDGGGNAWRLDLPAGQPVTVELRWTPQRWVTAALWLSLAAAVACIVVVVAARRRPGDDDTAPDEPVEAARPEPLAWPAAGAVAAGAGVIAVLVVAPVYGPLVAAPVLVAARRPGGLRASALAAVATLAVVTAYAVARLAVSNPAADFGWTAAFEAAHRPTLAAVVLVGADAVVVARSTRRRRAPC